MGHFSYLGGYFYQNQEILFTKDQDQEHFLWSKAFFNIKALTLFDHTLLFSRAILLFRSHFLKSRPRWYVLRGDCFEVIFKRVVNGQIFDLDKEVLWYVLRGDCFEVILKVHQMIKSFILKICEWDWQPKKSRLYLYTSYAPVYRSPKNVRSLISLKTLIPTPCEPLAPPIDPCREDPPKIYGGLFA